MEKVRLNKFIADCGHTSRRKADDLIVAGQVKVNNRVVKELGLKIDPRQDLISVSGKVLARDEVERLYIVFNKPRSVVTTTHDPEGRPTVLDYFKHISQRIYPVGRLDYGSEGLLILTNDGELAQKVLHPRHRVEKVYEVKVFGRPSERKIRDLRQGISIKGEMLRPKSVRLIGLLQKKTWLEFRLEEGRNREIRRLCEAFDLGIDKLRRVAIAGLDIGKLKPGDYTFLSKAEIEKKLGIHSEPIKYKSPKRTISFERLGRSVKMYNKGQKSQRD